MRSDSSFISGFSVGTGSAATSLELQLDNLRKKLHVMDKKRKEDHEKIVRLQSENKDSQRLETIVRRLQAKLTPMHDEVVGLRTRLQESETERAKLLQSSASQDEVLEMAALDREMAEEKVEHLLDELNALKEQCDTLEVEYEALREENALYEELRANGELGTLPSGDGSHNTAELAIDNAKLIKKNEQLQAALLKIRDMMQDQEHSYKEEIERLSENASSAKSMNESFAQVQEQLKDAEDIIYELRVQLDDALGAEDIIENLAEKNHELTERCQELQHTIEELETLKALNDELESNHILTEKQLMLEFDELEAMHAANETKLNEAQERNAYLESAIVKFRDVVTTLESDLAELRASNQLINADSAAMAVHTKSLMELNMKLNNTSLQANSKTMDLQLRKFEAEQAIEQLSIVKCYLSDDYGPDEASVNALLRLERICFMAQVIEDFLSARADASADDLIPVTPCVKIIISLGEIKRYASALSFYLRHTDPETFQKYSNLYTQAEPVEQIFNGILDILRSNNLQEETFLQELEEALPRFWAVYEECRKQQDLEPRQELLINDLSQIQNSLQFIRDLFAQINALCVEADVDASNPILAGISAQLASSSRVKVFTAKLTKELAAHYEGGVQAPVSFTSKISGVSSRCKSLVQCFIQTLEDVQNSARASESGQQSGLSDQVSTIFRSRFKAADSQEGTEETDEQTAQFITHEFQAIVNEMKDASTIDQDTFEAVEQEPSPWTVNATRLKELQSAQAEKETEIVALKAQVQKLATSLRSRDKSIEEFEVKVGLLNSKMKKSKEQAEIISELRQALSGSIAQENRLKESIEKLRKSLVDQETYLTNKWRKEGLMPGKSGTKYGLQQSEAMRLEQLSAAALRDEIKGLRETVSHLTRVQNTQGTKTADEDYSWLDLDSGRVTRVSSKASREYRAKVRGALSDARNSMLEIQPVSIKKPQQVVPSFDRRDKTAERKPAQSMWTPRKANPAHIVVAQIDTYYKVRLILQQLASYEL